MTPSTQTQTPWLDVEQQRVWRAFLGGVTVLMDQLDRDLRTEHDLSMAEYEILVRLSEAPGRSIRMAELASSVAHSRSRVTHTISRLERDGFVERAPFSQDRRGVSAVLTDAGFAALETAAHTHVRGVHDYLIENTDADELESLGHVMEKVVQTLHGQRF